MEAPWRASAQRLANAIPTNPHYTCSFHSSPPSSLLTCARWVIATPALSLLACIGACSCTLAWSRLPSSSLTADQAPPQHLHEGNCRRCLPNAEAPSSLLPTWNQWGLAFICFQPVHWDTAAKPPKHPISQTMARRSISGNSHRTTPHAHPPTTPRRLPLPGCWGKEQLSSPGTSLALTCLGALCKAYSIGPAP